MFFWKVSSLEVKDIGVTMLVMMIICNDKHKSLIIQINKIHFSSVSPTMHIALKINKKVFQNLHKIIKNLLPQIASKTRSRGPPRDGVWGLGWVPPLHQKQTMSNYKQNKCSCRGF